MPEPLPVAKKALPCDNSLVIIQIMAMLNTPAPSPMTFALKLLGMRSHSHEELERKLLKKGYHPESIGLVMAKLVTEGVLDDRIFSSNLITYRTVRKPSGKLKIHAELRKRGVSETIIDEQLKKLDMVTLCRRAAEKKIASLRCSDERERRKKVDCFLRNRGFGWQEIQAVLPHLFQSSPERDESC